MGLPLTGTDFGFTLGAPDLRSILYKFNKAFHFMWVNPCEPVSVQNTLQMLQNGNNHTLSKLG